MSEPNSADVSVNEDINTVLQLRPANYEFKEEEETPAQQIEDPMEGQRVDTANYIGEDDEDEIEDEEVMVGARVSSSVIAPKLENSRFLLDPKTSSNPVINSEDLYGNMYYQHRQ